MASPFIAVSGATGALGGRVAQRLAERGLSQRLVVRDPSRAPELSGAQAAQIGGYDDTDGMRAALKGIETLFLVSAGEAEDRVSLPRAAVAAAVEAGVRHIVYTSFLAASPDTTFTFGRDHFHTEEHIRSAGVAYTFLRDSIYLDFLPGMAGENGVICGPAGDGRLAAVARDDIADVAAAVLPEQASHEGQTYELTGPEALTMAEMAEHLSEVAGRPVTYEAETLDEARASRAHLGAPDWEVEGWVTSYAAIAAGDLEAVTDYVERIAGHPPISLRDYLRAHPESVDHLRA